MKYQVVFGKNMSEFKDRVNEALSEGWVCQGGVTTSVVDEVEWFYQAMTLVENE